MYNIVSLNISLPWQLMLGTPEQALGLLEDVLESVLAHGSLMDKGRALLLMARCQVALAGPAAEDRQAGTSLLNTLCTHGL